MAADLAAASPALHPGPAGNEDHAAFAPRRTTELLLILFAQSLGWAGYMLTSLNRDNAFPPHWGWVTAAWFALGVAIHLVVRRFAPYADPVFLPCVLALVGIGQAALHRYTLDFDPDATPDFLLSSQVIAVILGVAGCAAIVIFLKDVRRLNAYPYLLSAVALVLLLTPLIPVLGREVNGSRIWLRVGPLSLQPAELAKLILAASFAAYLVQNRDLLTDAGRKVLGVRLTRVRDIGPLLVMWGVSLVIMMAERDLGTSLLFFGLIVVMLFMATGQVRWLAIAGGLGAVGGFAAWKLFSHVQRRVEFWLHPDAYPDDATQILSAEYGMSAGGLAGSGWGLGWPYLTPYYFNDMIGPSLAEEIGVVGLMGLVLVYAFIGFRGLRLALMALDPFTKLFAAGLSFGFLLQVFVIVGGSTRLLPLTGLTSPFLSQGGSSMIANWLLVGLLLVISHQVRRPADLVAVDLADEKTMVVDVKQLRRLHRGGSAPLLDVPAGMVELDDDDTQAVPPPAFGVSADDETQAVAFGGVREDDETQEVKP